jgi:hypothetical protein
MQFFEWGPSRLRPPFIYKGCHISEKWAPPRKEKAPAIAGAKAARPVIANIGVHGQKLDIHLERLWNIAITSRLVDITERRKLYFVIKTPARPSEGQPYEPGNTIEAGAPAYWARRCG